MNPATRKAKNRLGYRFHKLARTSATYSDYWDDCQEVLTHFYLVELKLSKHVLKRIDFNGLVAKYWDKAYPYQTKLYRISLYPECYDY